MAKLKSTLKNMFLSLTLISLLSGGILAAVNRLTSEPIALTKKKKLEDAIKAVTPEFDNSPVEDAYMAAITEGDSVIVYPAKKYGQTIGVAVESNSMKGFSGEVRVIVGLDADGKLINYSVLQHSETPGLGTKMEEWFRTEKGNQNILGRNLSEGSLRLSKDGGDIDAITAATISSRAFLDAVNRAYIAYKGASADAYSGATSPADGSSEATSSQAESTTEEASPATDDANKTSMLTETTSPKDKGKATSSLADSTRKVTSTEADGTSKASTRTDSTSKKVSRKTASSPTDGTSQATTPAADGASKASTRTDSITKKEGGAK